MSVRAGCYMKEVCDVPCDVRLAFCPQPGTVALSHGLERELGIKWVGINGLWWDGTFLPCSTNVLMFSGNVGMQSVGVRWGGVGWGEGV